MPRIIGGIQTRTSGRKSVANAAQSRPPTPAPAPTLARSVERVRIDEGAEGQRLDNFLLGHWKGVPKTHVYRVIRSGEVRVNKGRAGADTRLALGDELRLPPVRTSAATGAPLGAYSVSVGPAPSMQVSAEGVVSRR